MTDDRSFDYGFKTQVILDRTEKPVARVQFFTLDDIHTLDILATWQYAHVAKAMAAAMQVLLIWRFRRDSHMALLPRDVMLLIARCVYNSIT